jgi:hypothetical protein
MKLSEYALGELKNFVSGDCNFTPYLSGPKLVELFNTFGYNDEYGQGFPSRNKYVLDKLLLLNGKRSLNKVFEIIFSKRHFRNYKDLDLKSAVNEANSIIELEGYKLTDVGGVYRIILKEATEFKTSEIYFEQIQSQIKEEIIKAKYTIWIAVAWFTDKELYNLLIQKKREGVNIQLLIIDDEINNNSGINFGKDFWVGRVAKKGAFGNLMHHKFCIIDLKTVIHGTYNWTNKARFNNETIDIENGRENAEKFADEFIKLKNL